MHAKLCSFLLARSWTCTLQFEMNIPYPSYRDTFPQVLDIWWDCCTHSRVCQDTQYTCPPSRCREHWVSLGGLRGLADQPWGSPWCLWERTGSSRFAEMNRSRGERWFFCSYQASDSFAAVRTSARCLYLISVRGLWCQSDKAGERETEAVRHSLDNSKLMSAFNASQCMPGAVAILKFRSQNSIDTSRSC